MGLGTMTILIVAVFWLAYSNGANGNFKGTATLYGSSTATFGRALLWATLATAAGSLVSLFAAGSLIKAFSGNGVVTAELVGTPQLLISIAAAAGITVFAATQLGMPTSTTHALTGALVGIALASSGVGSWKTLLGGFAAPLLLSPVIAVILTAVSYVALRRLRSTLGITKETCVCVGNELPVPVIIQAGGGAVLADTQVSVTVDQMSNCIQRYQGRLIGISAQTAVDSVHYLSAGAVCFSRAVNDTPKIAALLFASGAQRSFSWLGLVALAMTVGGLLNSRRVAETMSKRITDLNSGQGLSANLVTSFLVLIASSFGVPVSTTHVSCGSIFGIGLATQARRWKIMAQIVAAWLTTLPIAALLGAAIFLLLRRMM